MSTTQTPATEAHVTGEGDASVAGQLALDLSPLVQPTYEPTMSIAERWESWKAANPWVMSTLERLVQQWLDAGHHRVGMKAIWEVLRFQYGTTTGDRFKANNDFTSRAARDLITLHPEWADAFELRELRAA